MTTNNYNIPREICQEFPNNQWVLWRTENRNEKLAKVPYQINGNKAKTNDPATWNNYESTLKAYQNSSKFNGLGFVFTTLDDLVFIDLDDCFDKSGSLNGHTKLVESFIE